MSEEVKKEEQAVAQTKAELLAALQNDFATAVNKVYLNSVDREFAFREISVEEQKSLTRMMSANESRKDIIYDAQCAIINKASLTPGFDIYQFSDFDRLKLLLSLYQENMFQNQVKFTCEECGTENAYQIDFANTIAKLDAYKLEKKTFEYENRNFKYVFEIEYPTVKLVSRFYQSYCAKHGGRPVKREKKANEIMTNLEYVNLFIKSVTVETKANGNKREIVFANYKVGDVEDILAAFPQDVLYTEKGALKFIVNEYLKPVNDAFDKHECAQCGTIHEKGSMASSESFF